MELSRSKIKKFFIFTFWFEHQEISYIFSKETFLLYFGKWNFLHFRKRKPPKILIIQETELSNISGGFSKAQKTKISYISPKKVMNNFF